MKNGKREMDKIKKDISDLNTRLARLATGTGHEMARKTGDKLNEALSELDTLKSSVIEELTDAGRKVDDYVKEKHWQVGAAAITAGLISGYILGKKK